MNHKQMTAHIRNRIKVAGIKARVRLYAACGVRWIQVAGATSDQQFTAEEQRVINRIAKGNHLTGARGLEINELVPFGNQADFVFHG